MAFFGCNLVYVRVPKPTKEISSIPRSGFNPKILLQLVTRLLVMKAAIERGAVTNLTTNDSKVAKM